MLSGPVKIQSFVTFTLKSGIMIKIHFLESGINTNNSFHENDFEMH
jgi:hypothetical protein